MEENELGTKNMALKQTVQKRQLSLYYNEIRFQIEFSLVAIVFIQ